MRRVYLASALIVAVSLEVVGFYVMGAALCGTPEEEPLVIPPKGTPIIEDYQMLSERSVILPVKWERTEATSFYLSSHWVPNVTTLYSSPYIYSLDFNDPLYRRAEEVAHYLWDLGFAVSYNNVAHKDEEGYQLGMTLSGGLRLFEVIFQMEIRSYHRSVFPEGGRGRLVVDDYTTPVIPEPIRDFARVIEPIPPVKYYGEA